MLLIISPAKTLDYDTAPVTERYTQPEYLDQAQQLVERARRYSVAEITQLMKVSDKIAKLNYERFQQWHRPFTPENAKQAVLAFKGDVYSGLDAESFSAGDFDFAQQHLRILSGLYGLLRPLDLMQPYRLEMGRKIDTERGRNLYEFWGELITDALNRQLAELGSDTLINLASNEYFKAVKPKALAGRIITPEFKDYKNGQYRIMGVYAKKARGMLSRYVIENRITDPEKMKHFTGGGYAFDESLSDGDCWVFSRKR